VHPAERSIRTVKERARYTVQSLPFGYYPLLLAAAIIYDSISNLNDFSCKNGITDYISPASFVTGAQKKDYNHIKLSIGDYVEVYEDNNYQTNSTHTRSTPAITLNAVNNSTGSYYFMSLITGARLTHGQWTALPMPQ